MRYILLLSLAVLIAGCTSAGEGSVLVVETTSGIQGIKKPQDGLVGLGPMTTYHIFNTTTFTFPVDVTASTKDNAALTIKIQATVVPPSSAEDVTAFVRKFGLDDTTRKTNAESLLAGHINTETKNAVAAYEAYGLLANQEAIQKRLLESLIPIIKQQMWMTVESIQIIGRPDFLDDRIETAASAVVANQKAKEAAEADLARAKVDAEKKQVEAQTFKDPAMLEIKKLELQLQIKQAEAEGIGRHNGPLTIVNGNTPMQLRQQ